MVLILRRFKNFQLLPSFRLYSQANAKPQKYEEKTCSNHVYKNLYPWKTLNGFVDHIHSSVVYNEGGLIAINKPYGVPVYRHRVDDDDEEKTQNVKQTISQSGVGYSVYSLEDSLEELKSRLNVSNLSVIKSTERFTSGVTLLSTSEKVSKRVQKSIIRAKPMKRHIYKYWIISHGLPNPLIEQKRVSMELVNVNAKNKQPIINLKVSQNAMKLQSQRIFCYDMQPVATNKTNCAGLLQFAVTSNKWHFIRVLAARKAICLLGDNMYNSRIKTLLGKYVPVAPSSSGANDGLNPSFLKHLKLPSYEDHVIPTLMHLHELELTNYHGSDMHLSIQAPPPEHFLWTCQQLGLLPHLKTTASAASQVGHQKFHQLKK